MHQPPYMRAPRKITTEEVQLYLDENKKLILAIMKNKNLRKLDECAKYQELLQQNLMYLAAIADWQQPRTPDMPPQMTPPLGMQPEYCMQPENYMQHPQAVAMAQQQGICPPNMPLQFGNPQQQLHQQAIQGQMALRPEWINNDMYPMHSEAALGVGSCGGPPSTAGPHDALGRSMQGASEGGDGHGNSAAVHNLSNIVSSYLKD
ncbi:GRF1-interacting factor 3 [Spatholobus suberectus]|nr:GRF1-interacting factor 3 [Spatholobus suberectus]